MSMKQLMGFALFAGLAVLCADSSRAQWVPTNGPGYGPAITALAIHDGKVFAGISASVYKDLFVSGNAGKTWDPVTTASYYYAVTTLISHKPYLFAMPCAGLMAIEQTIFFIV